MKTAPLQPGMILHTPMPGTMAWPAGALQRSLPGASKKMLTQTLRELGGSGLLTCHVQGTAPPAVGYRLTAPGRRSVQPIGLL